MAAKVVYRGACANQIEKSGIRGLQKELISLFSKVGLNGEQEVNITKVSELIYPTGISLIGNTNFSVDMVFSDGRVSVEFYITPPLGKRPYEIFNRIKNAKVNVVERVVLSQPKPLGRIPNRTFVPPTKVYKPIPKKIEVKKKPTKVAAKKTDNLLWVIAKLYKLSKSERDQVIICPTMETLDKIADIAYARGDWLNLATINDAIENFKP